MDTVGPISRSVEDAAITLGAIAGHDDKDPYSWTSPVPDYRQALDGDISGLRIGVITEIADSDLVEPEVREAVDRAIATLGELGAVVEEVSLPLVAHAGVVSSVLLGVEPALNHRDWIRERIQDYGHDNRISLLTGSILPAHALLQGPEVAEFHTGPSAGGSGQVRRAGNPDLRQGGPAGRAGSDHHQ